MMKRYIPQIPYVVGTEWRYGVSLIHEQGKSDGNAQEETLRDALLL